MRNFNEDRGGGRIVLGNWLRLQNWNFLLGLYDHRNCSLCNIERSSEVDFIVMKLVLISAEQRKHVSRFYYFDFFDYFDCIFVQRHIYHRSCWETPHWSEEAGVDVRFKLCLVLHLGQNLDTKTDDPLQMHFLPSQPNLEITKLETKTNDVLSSARLNHFLCSQKWEWLSQLYN